MRHDVRPDGRREEPRPLRPPRLVAPESETWPGGTPRLDARDRRFQRRLRDQLLLRGNAMLGADNEKEAPVTFTYAPRLPRDPRLARYPSLRRRRRILLLAQAVALLLIAAGVALVPRTPGASPPSARAIVQRAIAALHRIPTGATHQVIFDYYGTNIGTPAARRSWPRPFRFPTTVVATVTGVGFTSGTPVTITFNEPYSADGLPLASAVAPTKILHVDTLGRIDDRVASRKNDHQAAGCANAPSDTICAETWTEGSSQGSLLRMRAGTFIGAQALMQAAVGPRTILAYDGPSNSYDSIPASRLRGDRRAALDPYGAGAILDLLRGAARRPAPALRLLPMGHLFGSADYVVEFLDASTQAGHTARVRSGWRLFIDARDYQVRGADRVTIDARGKMTVTPGLRMPIDERIADGRLPAHAFTFSPPAGAAQVEAVRKRPAP